MNSGPKCTSKCIRLHAQHTQCHRNEACVQHAHITPWEHEHMGASAPLEWHEVSLSWEPSLSRGGGNGHHFMDRATWKLVHHPILSCSNTNFALLGNCGIKGAHQQHSSLLPHSSSCITQCALPHLVSSFHHTIHAPHLTHK